MVTVYFPMVMGASLDERRIVNIMRMKERLSMVSFILRQWDLQTVSSSQDYLQVQLKYLLRINLEFQAYKSLPAFNIRPFY